MEFNKNNSSDLDAFEEYVHDTPEQIKMCLNCDKPECTNCLWWKD